jgi:hypothetical protein
MLGVHGLGSMQGVWVLGMLVEVLMLLLLLLLLVVLLLVLRVGVALLTATTSPGIVLCVML